MFFFAVLGWAMSMKSIKESSWNGIPDRVYVAESTLEACEPAILGWFQREILWHKLAQYLNTVGEDETWDKFYKEHIIGKVMSRAPEKHQHNQFLFYCDFMEWTLDQVVVKGRRFSCPYNSPLSKYRMMCRQTNPPRKIRTEIFGANGVCLSDEGAKRPQDQTSQASTGKKARQEGSVNQSNQQSGSVLFTLSPFAKGST